MLPCLNSKKIIYVPEETGLCGKGPWGDVLSLAACTIGLGIFAVLGAGMAGRIGYPIVGYSMIGMSGTLLATAIGGTANIIKKNKLICLNRQNREEIIIKIAIPIILLVLSTLTASNHISVMNLGWTVFGSCLTLIGVVILIASYVIYDCYKRKGGKSPPSS